MRIWSESHTTTIPWCKGTLLYPVTIPFSILDTRLKTDTLLFLTGKALPVGIMGSLGIVAVLYALMSAVITGMVPSTDIDVDAPFAIAFRQRDMRWAESIISFGAVAAITTALVSSLMGQPRVYMVMARDGLLPKWFATVHPTRGTPVNASLFTGVTTGVLSLLVDIEILAQLVSIGTLAIFASVCAGLLARRHTPEGDVSVHDRTPALLRCFGLVVACVLFAATNVVSSSRGTTESSSGSATSSTTTSTSSTASTTASYVVSGLLFGAIAAATVSFNSLPRYNTPKKGFCTPFVPYLPAAGVLATTQLIASLGPLAWLRFVVYTVLCAVAYVWYGAAGIRSGRHDDTTSYDSRGRDTPHHPFQRLGDEDEPASSSNRRSPFATTLYGDENGLHLENTRDVTDGEVELVTRTSRAI